MAGSNPQPKQPKEESAEPRKSTDQATGRPAGPPSKKAVTSEPWPETIEPIVDQLGITTQPIEILFGEKVIQGGRPNTEDYARVDIVSTTGGLEMTLGVVADGVGGNVFGEEASREAVETIFRFVQKHHLDDKNGIPLLLQRALEEANRRVYRRSRIEKEKRGMATTAIAAAIYQNLLFLANIGDSRAYIIRDKQLIQLSLDHSWENEVVREGHYSLEEAQRHPKAGELRRSIGTRPEMIVDLGFYPDQDPAKATDLTGNQTVAWEISSGDRILLCSDGLIKARHDNPQLPYVSDQEIVQAITGQAPPEAAETLTAIASARGVDDNVSVIILETAGSQRTPQAAPRIPKQGKVGKTGGEHQQNVPSGNRVWRTLLLIAIPLLILIGGGYLFLQRNNLLTAVEPEPSENEAVITLAPVTEGDEGEAGATEEGAPLVAEVALPTDTPLPPAVLPGGVEVAPSRLGAEVDPNGESITLNMANETLVVSSASAPFEVKNSFGAAGRLSGSGPGLMGIVYVSEPYLFEVHCLIGNCEVVGDIGGQLTLAAGEMGRVGASGLPGDPSPAQVEPFLGLSGAVPTPTPTMTLSPTPLPTETTTPIPVPIEPQGEAPTAPTGGSTVPADPATTESPAGTDPFDPDGDGVPHNPANGQFDLCQDAPGNAATCGCPENNVPSSCSGDEGPADRG